MSVVESPIVESPIADLVIGERHRQDLGDIDSLIESISAVGLLMPVAVTTDNRLIAGARRIEAFRRLGRNSIPTFVVETIDDVIKALRAEADENTCRIPLTPIEAESLAGKLEGVLAPEARKRQLEGRQKGGRTAGRGRNSSVGNSDKAKHRSDRTPEQAAKATGYSEKTLRRVREIKEAAEKHPEIYDPLVQRLSKQGVKVNSVYKEFHRLEERQKLEAAAKKAKRQKRTRPDVRHCEMSELISSLSGAGVRAIITDPPYERDAIPLYGQLAESIAKHLDYESVTVAVMCGQSYLPQILEAICQHLPYRWIMAYLTPGGQAAQIWKRKVNTFWKPVLVFGRAPDKWTGDVVCSKVNGNDKRFHKWGQSVSGMVRLVESLTGPDDLVCDPFLGAGTTGVACALTARRFVGGDADEQCVSDAEKRILTVTE